MTGNSQQVYLLQCREVRSPTHFIRWPPPFNSDTTFDDTTHSRSCWLLAGSSPCHWFLLGQLWNNALPQFLSPNFLPLHPLGRLGSMNLPTSAHYLSFALRRHCQYIKRVDIVQYQSSEWKLCDEWLLRLNYFDSALRAEDQEWNGTKWRLSQTATFETARKAWFRHLQWMMWSVDNWCFKNERSN